MNTDMWKYDDVYAKLAGDSRFYPLIVTAMRNIPEMEIRLREQEAMVEYFSKRGYAVSRGYDPIKNTWVSLRKLKPDIIFYTQPYSGVIEHSFEYIYNLDSLLCYSPYAFLYCMSGWSWNSILVQYCWKVFYAVDAHLRACEQFSRIGSENASAAGYSFEEEYANYSGKVREANTTWRNDSRKRVIWAPHHSITDAEMFKVSSFLEISDLMVQLRDAYKDKLIFAFKPHPVLKPKLYKIWGKEKTDAYYNDWSESPNSFLAEGDYIELFAGSDAMIHCSGSFIVEYLYTGKPVAYVYSKSRNPPDIGELGDAALKAHYSIKNKTDIERFLCEVVIKGDDTMCDVRRKTVDKYFKSPNGKMFSENVYSSILSGLGLN